MKAQSKNRKSPTCSRCRFHGERDVRVLQHKCPYKDCSCPDCLLVKKRSNIYRAQKTNLDKQDENSNEVSSPGSGSTGSSRCLGSPQIPMHPANMGDSNEPSLQNPWSTNLQQPLPPPPSQQQQQQPQHQHHHHHHHHHQQQQQQQQHQHQQHQHQPTPSPSSSLVAPPQPHQLPPSSINSIPPNKNSGYSNIKSFHTLCLTFQDHSPDQLKTLLEQCGNDYEKTIEKILLSKWYSDPPAPSNDYSALTNDQSYLNNTNTNTNNTNLTNSNTNTNTNTNNTNNNASNNNMNNNTSSINHNNNNPSNNNHNSNSSNNSNSNSNCNSNHHHNHNNNHNNNLEYPSNEDDTRLSFANCHYNQQPNQRMMTAPNFNNQDYTGDELVNRSVQPHNTDAMASNWSYGDTNRYSATSNYPNNWNQGDYPTWSNASSNFWPSNGHATYSYVDQNDANAMSYYYGRRETDYSDPSGHIDRTVRPEVGPNISSNYDFDSY